MSRKWEGLNSVKIHSLGKGGKIARIACLLPTLFVSYLFHVLVTTKFGFDVWHCGISWYKIFLEFEMVFYRTFTYNSNSEDLIDTGQTLTRLGIFFCIPLDLEKSDNMLQNNLIISLSSCKILQSKTDCW